MKGTTVRPHSPQSTEELETLLERRFTLSETMSADFFESESERIAQACWAMARRFHRGGRLISFGTGSSATDAQHISVEFVHPVIVGKRALPAIALVNDGTTISGIASAHGYASIFDRQLDTLGRAPDIAVGISAGGACDAVVTGMRQARTKGMLSIALTGSEDAHLEGENLDFWFAVPSSDPFVVQETHETLYHVLWELVHVFFEHEGLLEADE